MKFWILIIGTIISLFIGTKLSAQACDSLTPSFVANLSNDPNGTYISPQVIRNGHCCGASGNVKCIKFIVTLHPDAEGVLFDIYSGAVPGGALFYQINCGPPQTVGQPICLSGTGPHIITFCKPGNNINEYRILSVSEPVLPDSVNVNDGCTKQIGTQGFDKSTITWTTVFPTPVGAYNSYLDCTSQCDTVNITPQTGYPPYIDIQVCGLPFGGCDTIYTCDTVRVNFYSNLDVKINPKNPTICYGDTSVSIEAIASGGSPPYVYHWSNGDSVRFSNVNTGTYWVELGDVSGCPPTYDTVTVTAFSLPISANAGNDTASCVEGLPLSLSGTIIAASGGTWVGNGTFSPSTDSLMATYVPDSLEIVNGAVNLLLITTGNGTCPADTDSLHIDIITFNSILNSGNIPVSCLGDSDGTAWVMATGSRAPFIYTWGAAAGNQVNDSATGLPAGDYPVTITDSAGCILDTTVEVIEADSILSVEITTTAETCFGQADGTAQLTISGGVSPYTVTWDVTISNFTPTSASNLTAGTYSVNIIDSFGCIIDTTFIVSGPLQPLAVTLTKVDIGCKNGNDGTATATASGGTAPYSYQWDDSTGLQTGTTASNLSAGIYEVLVTDTMGCTVSDTISLNDPPSSITYADTFTQPTCYGWNDGTATVFPSGGTPPYSYLWDSLAGNQTTQTATGLSAGTYSVIIFDLNSCLLATPVIVNDPPPLFATVVEIINVSCKGGANGSAKVIPTGGVGPYTYQWDSLSGFQTDSIAINLKAGVYSVLVYDQIGCSYVPGIEILEPDDSLAIFTGSTPALCKGDSNGTAFGEIIGGTPPYTITWDANAGNQTTDTAFNLKAGTYKISVSDSNNCMADSFVTVSEPPTGLLITTDSIEVLCFGDSNGVAIVSASGSLPPYVYTWDQNAGGQLNDSAAGLGVGTYSVNIRDDHGCELDTSVTVTQPAKLVLSGSQLDVFCYGDNTAWANIIPAGGVPPYGYQWDAGTGNQTTDTATALGAGQFKVTVTDNNGCEADSVFSITQPDTFLMLSPGKVDVDCYGDSSGKAFITATGATPPYSYLWGANAGSQITDTAYNLKVGTYMITVTDSLGCTDNYIITIKQPPGPLTTNPGKTDITCFNGSNGKAFANASGGTPPYSYLWTQGTANQTDDTAKNLAVGEVYLTVTDTNGCFTEMDTLVISQPTEVLVTISNSDTICIGDSIQLFASGSGGNGPPYFYRLLPFTLINPPVYVKPTQTTTYGVRAIDPKGCESNTGIVTINIKDLLTDEVEVTSSGDICLGDTVEITGTHSGIYQNYIYKWNISRASLQFLVSPTQSSYYTLTITDDCAATVKDSVLVNVFPLPKMALNSVIAAGCVPLTVKFKNLVSDPQITNYSWELGDGTTSIDPSPLHTYSDTGEYIVNLKVTNVFGCTSESDSANLVRVYPLPIVNFISNPTFTDIRYSLISFTSASSPGSHYWTFGDTGKSNIRNPQYQYTDTGNFRVNLMVVDTNGCRDSLSKSIVVGPYFNIQIPNAFTPNTGGSSGGRYDPNGMNNYVFFPVTKGVEEYQLLIFNRWGELIFESEDYELGWDGYYRGKLASQEVYVWKLKIRWENGQTYEGVGDVTLFK